MAKIFSTQFRLLYSNMSFTRILFLFKPYTGEILELRHCHESLISTRNSPPCQASHLHTMSSCSVAYRFLNCEELRQRLLVDWEFATQGLFLARNEWSYNHSFSFLTKRKPRYRRNTKMERINLAAVYQATLIYLFLKLYIIDQRSNRIGL